MSEHSKLPWKWDEEKDRMISSDGKCTAIFSLDNTSDRDFILKAVNNHDRLDAKSNALDKFGRHDNKCPVASWRNTCDTFFYNKTPTPPKPACTCGFDAAKEA